MMLQILVHHLFGDLPGTPYAITNTPEMPAPVACLQRRVLLQELTRRAPLDTTHDLADRMLGRIGKMQMDMVTTDDALDHLYIKRIADLSYQVSTPLLDLSAQHPVAIFGAEDQVDLESIDAMATSALLHGANLLKVSC